MRELADRWLALKPPVETYRFLKTGFRQLQRKHGGVYGARIATPRLIPADRAA
jgi:hypothetical protein